MSARAVAIGVIFLFAGFAIGVAGVFFPPFNTLTHEFTTLFTVVTSVALYFVCALLAGTGPRAERAPTATRGALREVVLIGMMLAVVPAVGALIVLSLANATAFGCRIWAGLPFFVTSWAPANLFAIVSGTVLGGLGCGRRILIGAFLGFAFLSLLHDGLQLYYGPRIYPVDFLIGQLDALTQRADLALSRVHLLQRFVLLLTTAAIWQSGLWRCRNVDAEPSASFLRSRAFLLCVAVAGIVLFAGSYAGIGVGRANLHRAYDVTDNTPNFTLRFADDPDSLASLDAIKRRAEWSHAFLTENWDLVDPAHIRLYVLRSVEELERFTGFPAPHAGLHEVFIDISSATTAALDHEIAHALHRDLNPSPRILLRRGVLEGLAMAYEQRYALIPGAHAVQAAALQLDSLPSARSLMDVGGFVQSGERTSYQSAGSFIGFLTLEFGFDKVLEFQRSLSFRKAFGKNIGELDEDWRRFLANVPVSPEAELTALAMFNPVADPAYASLSCPKVGARPDPAVQRAEYALGRKDYERAAAAFSELFQQTKSFRWAYSAVSAYDAAGLYEDALRTADDMYPALEPDRFQEWQAGIQMRTLLVKLQRWNSLYLEYDKLRSGDLPFPFDLRMVEALVRNPYTREYYAEILRAGNPVIEQRLWEEAIQRWPDFPPLVYLYSVRGIPESAPLTERAMWLLRTAEHSPDAANAVAPELITLYNHAMDLRDYEVARQMCVALQQHCTDDRYRLEGSIAARRIEFEQPRSISDH